MPSFSATLRRRAANRTIEFDIHYSTDIALVGRNLRLRRQMPIRTEYRHDRKRCLSDIGRTKDGDTLTPFFSGAVTDISGGVFSGIQSH